MILSYLIKSLGISIVSTCIYWIMTSDENISNDLRKKHALRVFTIVLAVTFSVLFIVSGNSQTLVVRGNTGGSSPAMNTKPPF